MLILDLQSRKKGVLRQILTTRRELADLNEAEMRETGARRPRPLGVEALRLLAPALARPAPQAPQAHSRSDTCSRARRASPMALLGSRVRDRGRCRPIEAPRAGNRGGNTASPGPRRVGRLVAGGASVGALVSAATGGRDAAATTNTAAVGAWVRCAAARARQEVCRPIFDENPYRLC